jgi:hypothetical protein
MESRAVVTHGEGTAVVSHALAELVPKISDEMQDKETMDIQQINSTLSQISTLTTKQRTLMEDLVKVLESSQESLRRCTDGIACVHESTTLLDSEARTHSRNRSKTLSDVKTKVEKAEPQKLFLQAIHNTCRIHVDETRAIYDYLCGACDSSLHAMCVGWEEISALYLSLKEEHTSRLHAGDLNALTCDDLKIILHTQGLSQSADIFDQEGLNGSILSSALRGKRADQAAAELEDIFKGTIPDLCNRKRVVHYIQLAHFGLDMKQHSVQPAMGSPNDPCCKWSSKRLMSELQTNGFSDVSSKLANLNGEVLLLLNRSDLRDLSISALATQQRCACCLSSYVCIM